MSTASPENVASSAAGLEHCSCIGFEAVLPQELGASIVPVCCCCRWCGVEEPLKKGFEVYGKVLDYFVQVLESRLGLCSGRITFDQALRSPGFRFLFF